MFKYLRQAVTHAVVWCEMFSQFITAAALSEIP